MTVETYRPRCFLDVEIAGQPLGRVIVELFSDICPVTCENFRALCTGEKGIGKTTNKPLHYKGVPLHRVIKNFMIQGGDFVAGNGTGGESIYGGAFKDENFELKHDKPLLLSMANRGKDTNGSQFFITTQPTPHLDSKHTVFGHVISGEKVISEIENLKTDQNSRPMKDVKITNCGELVLKVKTKDKKRKKELVSESSMSGDSDSGEIKDKSKKKKRKHSKRHKKEKKERKNSSSEAITKNEEEDTGLMVDPDEIPSVPTNNFLMRRTSPIGDNDRRSTMRTREPYSFQSRPSRSRSGRKIKGRGFMRYRTPSPTGSRSGSETPPHWKQAQRRLRSIRDVVTKTEPMPSDASQSPSSDVEVGENVNRNTSMQSRLGMVTKKLEASEQKDARENLRDNRRNREWSHDKSPNRYSKQHPLDSRGRQARPNTENVRDRFTDKFREASPRRRSLSKDRHHSSPLRSKIVVKANSSRSLYEKNDNQDRYKKSGYGKNRRDTTPDRKIYSYGSHLEMGSRQKNASHRKPPLGSDSHQSNLHSRKKDADGSSYETQKDLDRKQLEAKKQKSRFKTLELDLFKYRKDIIDSEESDEEKKGSKDDAKLKTPMEVDDNREVNDSLVPNQEPASLLSDTADNNIQDTNKIDARQDDVETAGFEILSKEPVCSEPEKGTHELINSKEQSKPINDSRNPEDNTGDEYISKKVDCVTILPEVNVCLPLQQKDDFSIKKHSLKSVDNKEESQKAVEAQSPFQNISNSSHESSPDYPKVPEHSKESSYQLATEGKLNETFKSGTNGSESTKKKRVFGVTSLESIILPTECFTEKYMEQDDADPKQRPAIKDTYKSSLTYFQEASYEYSLPDVIPLPEETKPITKPAVKEFPMGEIHGPKLPNQEPSLNFDNMHDIAKVSKNEEISEKQASLLQRQGPLNRSRSNSLDIEKSLEKPEFSSSASPSRQIRVRSPSSSPKESHNAKLSPLHISKSYSRSKSPTSRHSKTVSKRSRSPTKKRSKSPAYQKSLSPAEHRSKSPMSRKSRSPMSPRSKSPCPPKLQSPVPDISKSPRSQKSRSPVSRRSKSPCSQKSHSPASPRSKSPRSQKSHSPVSRRSKSPFARKLRSPVSRRSKSPFTRKSRSPVSRKSKSPFTRKSRSPVSQRSKSPFTRKSRSPMSRRSKSPSSRKSRSPGFRAKNRSKSPRTRRSRSPIFKRSKSRSPVSRKSRSPNLRKSRSPTSRRSKSRSSRSRSRSRRRSRSSLRNRNRGRYSRSPDVRPRRSWSRPRNDGRASRFYRYSGLRNRSPDRRGTYQRRYTKSPNYRGRARGRSGARRSRSHSRSRSATRRRRSQRHSSSSSNSSTSRNSSSSRSEGKKKKSSSKRIAKGRSKRSTSSSASTRSKRSSSHSNNRSS